MLTLEAHAGAEPVRRSGIARGLTREDIERAIAEWQVVGREGFLRAYESDPANKYMVVVGGQDIDALALLRGARVLAGLDGAARWRGDRREVAEPLRRLGFFVDDGSANEGPLGSEARKYVGRAGEFVGSTDVAATRMSRREQVFLRGSLGIGSGLADATGRCSICQRIFPENLLVAGHIKPRAQCSEAERLDMPSIGLPICLVGCDAFFEKGYVTVGPGGGLVVSAPEGLPADLGRVLATLHDRSTPAWNTEREKYFAWHRQFHSQKQRSRTT